MKSYLCKFVRKQTVSLYVEAPSSQQAEEIAKEMGAEFLQIDEALEEDLKEDLHDGTVKISGPAGNGEVTKYVSEESCDVEV